MRARRVAFVACTARGSELRGAQGTLDAEAVSERLGQPDAGFEIRAVDPSVDVAGQIDEFFASGQDEAPAALFYASASAIRAEGELLLVLDAEQPETGDALGDVIDALAEGAAGVLVVLDLRCTGGESELEPTELARLARLAARTLGVELVVAVRQLSPGDDARASKCSPFTRAFLQALDAADPEAGVSAAEVYDAVRDDAEVIGVPMALAYVAAEGSLALVVARPSPVEPGPPEGEGEASPPPAAASNPPDEPPPGAPAVGAPLAPPPPDLAQMIEPPPSVPPPSTDALVPTPASLPPARPSAPPVRLEDVLAEADRLAGSAEDEEAIARYRKALALAGSAPERDRARIYVKIGELKLRQSKTREAIAALEKGLSLAPESAEAEGVMWMLHGLYHGERDHRSAHGIQLRILERLSDPNQIATALVAFGKAWWHDYGDVLRAREDLERAAELRPDDVECLKLLLDLAEQGGRVDDALLLRRRLAETRGARDRAMELYALARDMLHKQKREDEALDVFEAALEADPSLLEPLSELSAVLGERQEWGELEGAYRRMLDRLPRIADAELRLGAEHELCLRLGVLLEENLEDPDGALEAYERAAAARPREAGAHKSAARLARALGRATVAEAHLLSLTALDPKGADAFHALFDVLMRTERLERATDVAAALVHLGAATDRERALFEAESAEEPARPRGSLRPEDWRVLRADLVGPERADVELVADVLTAASRAIVASLAGLAKRAGKLPVLDEALRVDPETTTVSAARCLSWASRALGLPVPAVYLEEASVEAMTPVLREGLVSVVGAAALRGRSLADLSFVAGWHLAYHVPAHRVVRFCPHLDDLAACFVSAVAVAAPDVPIPKRVASLVELLRPEVERHITGTEDEARLAEAVLAFDAAGGRADLGALTRAMERAALRAGLLLAGRLDGALGAARTVAYGGMTAAEREAEIVAFSVSERCAALRATLGVVDS